MSSLSYTTVYLKHNDKIIGATNMNSIPRVGEELTVREPDVMVKKHYEVLHVEHDFHTIEQGLIPGPDSHYVFLTVRERKF